MDNDVEKQAELARMKFYNQLQLFDSIIDTMADYMDCQEYMEDPEPFRAAKLNEHRIALKHYQSIYPSSGNDAI